MKTTKPRIAVFIYLAGLVMIHMAVFWSLRHKVAKGYSDFTIYYCAGTIVRQGLGRQLYDEQTQFRIQQEFAQDVNIRQGPLPFNHPPFEALLFAPFSRFSYPVAFALWDLVNMAMLGVLPFLLRPHLPGLKSYSWPFWMLAMLAFFPIFFALLQGQDAILLLFLYTLSFVCLRKNRDVWAGGCLALGLFKFHLVVPFVLLLLAQGRKRVLYGFGIVAAVLAMISFAIVGGDAMISYPSYVLHLESTKARGAISPAGMANLRGILDIVLGSSPYFNAVVVTLSLGIIFFAAWQFHRSDNPNLFDLKFSLAAFATLLVSYHALGYDLSFLMLATWLMANELLQQGNFGEWLPLLITCVGTVLFFSPLPLLLLMRYGHFALMGYGVLLCMFGIAGEMSFRSGYSDSASDKI
jgi:Glycosyltransferase family 87